MKKFLSLLIPFTIFTAIGIAILGPSTPAEAQVVYSRNCCDAGGNVRCYLENWTPVGNACFCYNQGWGVTC